MTTFLLLAILLFCAGCSTLPKPSLTYQISSKAKILSRRTDEIQTPSGLSGNCLPVALKLQQFLQEKNIKTKLLVLKTSDVHHVVVAYDSDNDQIIDSVIDNGFITDFNPITTKSLSKYGKIIGECVSYDITRSTCKVNPGDDNA